MCDPLFYKTDWSQEFQTASLWRLQPCRRGHHDEMENQRGHTMSDGTL